MSISNIRGGLSHLKMNRRVNMNMYLYPRAGRPQSIPSSAYCRGLGRGDGCVLVFRVAFGFGCSVFAVVSFALFVCSRSVLVLVVPRGGCFVRPQCSFDCPQCWFVLGAGLVLRFWCWLAFALSRLVLDLAVVCVRRFRII